nr:bidirectional sugar transporter SWEET15 [Hemerocallis fulva]
MCSMAEEHHWAFAFGILGNIISFMVYLAPLPTFLRIYKKKSTQGFQSIPYVVALFSASLWIYYALLKSTNTFLLITINAAGCVIEAGYIIFYLIYAPRNARIYTAKLLLLLNVGLFGLIILLTLLLSTGSGRVVTLGWICVGFSTSVFVAPLSIMRLVIQTKSVEFMPFSLSFSLTLSAVVWFFYGFLSHDIYIALPNVLGFIFGVIQMLLYAMYMSENKPKIVEQHHAMHEQIITIAELGVVLGLEVDLVDTATDASKENIGGQGNECECECELTNIQGQEGINEMIP